MTKIQSILFENQDTKYKNFHAKLMPTISQDTIIGVRIPILRKLSKDLFKAEPKLVADFFQELPHKFYEENNLHAFFLEQITDFDKCIAETEKFLPFID
ncbi:MAG: DNA alkylation repair protein, partial [Spirochaetaceae bacterium]|nr:DNA alkylation repair protein [Spirochaetaceae bacterium]